MTREPRTPGIDVEDAVLGSARDLGAPGRDDEFGYVLIDPVAAIAQFPLSEGDDEPTEPELTDPEPTLPEPTTPEPTQPATAPPIVPPAKSSPVAPISNASDPAKLQVTLGKPKNGRTWVQLTVKTRSNSGVRPMGIVTLNVQARGSSRVSSYPVAPGRFSKTGVAKVTVPMSRHTYVWVSTASPKSITSAKRLVRVKADIRVTQKRKQPKLRTLIVTPGVDVRSVVRVQRKSGGKWRSIRNVTVKAKGHASLRLRPATYRFSVKASSYFDADVVSVRVR